MVSPQERLIYTLKTKQTRTLIDRYGVHIARIAEQSRDCALIAWALMNDDELRRDLIVDVTNQISEVTNLMIKLKSKTDA